MFAPKKNKKEDDPDDDVVTLFSTEISKTAQKNIFISFFEYNRIGTNYKNITSRSENRKMTDSSIYRDISLNGILLYVLNSVF